MKINQELVDRILQRARDSKFGIDEEPERKIEISNYCPQNEEMLALCLVSGFYQKYDLVSVFAATIEILQEENK